MIDPVDLTAALVRCPSVTPEEGGALRLLAEVLGSHGFVCTRVDRGDVANLYARCGSAGPVLGFNGHTDVVPPGEAADWTHPPFAGVIAGGRLWGRGAVDMKSAVAAFAAAATDWAAGNPARGSLALLITGDEEGPATDGTVALLDWMETAGERLDACIVGEPTSAETPGDTVKIGRRGSMTVRVRVDGVQGHAAYPERARNPLPPLVRLLDRLASRPLDSGSAHFDPSTLAITSVDTGNPASNVIPASARAVLNIRFNDHHASATLTARLQAEAETVAAAFGVRIGLDVTVSGESFLTPPGPFVEAVAAALARETGRMPVLSTSGGTSDARFIRAHCPVVEVGLVGKGLHAVDEAVPVEDIRRLAVLYRRLIDAALTASG